MSNIHVAIVGAGFAGLALCYYLQRDFDAKITLFDDQGVGGGASGIAAGLLHPYPGKEMRLSWRGDEAMAAACELLDVASQALGRRVYRRGVYRVALTPVQVEALHAMDAQGRALLSAQSPAMDRLCLGQAKGYMQQALTVAPRLYLEGLRKVCCVLGAHLAIEAVSWRALRSFDAVVIAAGARSQEFFPSVPLPLRMNKGQLLAVDPSSLSSLHKSVIGKGYLAYDPTWPCAYFGSTYEHHYTTSAPSLTTAKEVILPRIAQFIREPQAFKLLDCIAGLRASRQTCYHPLVDQMGPAAWVFTGLGSRGLLYHAYLGRLLAQAIAWQRRTVLPLEVRLK